MKIECSGTIGIVNTTQRPYCYKRKGYYISGRFVPPKKIRKYKTVPIKEPFLYGNIELIVDKDFVLGGIYVDENGMKYLCVTKMNFTEPMSRLKIVTTHLGKTFSLPKTLNLTCIANLTPA